MHSQPGQQSSRERSPKLFAIEGDTYLFVALVERSAGDGEANWLRQTLRVDPTAGDDDELVVTVTESSHVGDESGRVASRDQFTVSISLGVVTGRPQISTIRRALGRWHRSAGASVD